METKVCPIDYIFTALVAGIVVGLLTSIILSGVLYSFYQYHMADLSFLFLFLYVVGKVIPFQLAFSVIISLVVFIFQKIPFNIFRIKKRFSFFLSLIITINACFWVGFYLYSNILRFSQGRISQLANLAVVIFGILLVIVLYKVTPRFESLERKKVYKVLTLVLAVVSFSLFYQQSPFGIQVNAGYPGSRIERNYDSQGNYLSFSEVLSPKKLNVILFSIDTLRADGLSCYGNPRLTSPNIDSLSTDGIVFRNVVAPSSWTLPSHMSLMTSLYPSVHQCEVLPKWVETIERLNDHWVTLPEILKGFGYYTAAFTDGKMLGPVYNFDQGFEICDDSGKGIEKIAQKAIRWLEDYSSEKPFFLFLHCYDVHRYRPPEETEEFFVGEYSGKLKKLRQKGNSLELRVNSNKFYQLTEEDVRYLKDLYDAEIYKTDSEFGKILLYLKRNDMYDDTVIIITSDHGEEFWEYGRTGHGWSLHQNVLKVPLIIKSPTFSDSHLTLKQFVGLIDVAPTILDILDIPIPNEHQGISLQPLIEQGTSQYQDRSFIAEASHLGNQKCLISGGYSYLFDQYPPVGEDIFDWERFVYVWRNILHYSDNSLFDLVNDPLEKENILSNKTELAEEMRRGLLNEVRENLERSTGITSTETTTIDEETREHLKSLGYLE